MKAALHGNQNRTAHSGTSSVLSIAFFASSYPAKFIAPRGAIQKNLGTAPLKRPRGPSLRRMEKATICIDTGKPCGAVIIRVFITSKGVVTTAASPPDKAPTATVSQGARSRLRRFCATYQSNQNQTCILCRTNFSLRTHS